jgi:hypothetical protein
VVEERRGRYFLARAIWSNLTHELSGPVQLPALSILNSKTHVSTSSARISADTGQILPLTRPTSRCTHPPKSMGQIHASMTSGR